VSAVIWSGDMLIGLIVLVVLVVVVDVVEKDAIVEEIRQTVPIKPALHGPGHATEDCKKIKVNISVIIYSEWIS
jgi:hypothetical protein